MMRAPIRTKSKLAIVLLLSFSLAMLVYRFSGMYRGTRFSGARAAKVVTTEQNMPRQSLTAPGLYKVTKVVDGDTIHLSDGSLVRYIGVDTPEREQPIFEKATQENRAALEGKEVEVRFCTQRQTDKFGRRLGLVRAGNADVALLLIRQGLGRVFVDRACLTQEMLDSYFRASLDAYREGAGIWSAVPRKPISPDEVKGYVGKSIAVCGVVKKTYAGPTAFHIHYGEDYKTDFSAAFLLADEKLFSETGLTPDETLVGKNVAVFGLVSEREGPSIFLSSPVQAKIVNDCKEGF